MPAGVFGPAEELAIGDEERGPENPAINTPMKNPPCGAEGPIGRAPYFKGATATKASW